MAGRIRSLKPEWLENQRLGSCSDHARVASVALLLLADDHGRGRASPIYLANHIWTYSRDSRETLAKTESAIGELSQIGFIRLYEVEEQHYFEIPGWKRHQRVDHPGKPRVPGPEEGIPRPPVPPGNGHPRETLAPDQEKGVTSNEKGVTRREPEGNVAVAPTAPASPSLSRVSGSRKSGVTADERAVAFAVIAKLNDRSGRKFRAEDHVELVVKLLRRGFTVRDLKLVIWDRANDWCGKDDMERYLRPSTLFGTRKFVEYLAEAKAAETRQQREQDLAEHNARKSEPVSPLVTGLFRGKA